MGLSGFKGAPHTEQAPTEFGRIIDAVQQPLFVLDQEQRVILANRAVYRQFALRDHEVIGLHFSATGNRFLDGPALQTFIALIKRGSPVVENHEIEVVVPGLGTHVLLLTATTLFGERGAPPETIVVIDDVTESRHVEAEARSSRWRAERAKLRQSRFLAAASHDLRQSLQALSLMRAVLTRTLDQGQIEEASRLVTQLDKTADAMSSVLDTLLDVNQLEAGVLRPEKVDFRINDLIEKLRIEFAQHTQLRGLDWRVVRCGGTVHSDPRLVEQILRNLLSNAVKYTNEGKVLLGCRRRGDKIRIEVWDSGVGIPHTQISKIFREFQRVDNSTPERSRGFGLGLAIVRRFCDLLGHVVYVHSLPGSGSVFAIEVPIAQSSAEPPMNELSGYQQAVHCDAAVLIAEADPTVREMLSRLLASDGYRTLTAEDSEQARTLVLGAVQPDIIVAGYQFPNGITGLDLVGDVRELLGRRIPAAILTGDISTDVLREIARQGCSQRTKPTKAEDILRLARSLLARPEHLSKPALSPSPADTGRAEHVPAIFVVDDDASIREAMRDMFRNEEGWSVEAYASAETFLKAFHPEREGVLLVDAQMPGMDGIELLGRLQSENRMPPAIMVSGHADVRLAVRAMRAGAMAFLEKPVGYDELIGYVEQALELSRSAAARSSWHGTAAARIATLTVREHQVMELMLEGKPNKIMAHTLGISQRTVETHRATVMKKTQSRSLSELIHVAIAGSAPRP